MCEINCPTCNHVIAIDESQGTCFICPYCEQELQLLAPSPPVEFGCHSCNNRLQATELPSGRLFCPFCNKEVQLSEADGGLFNFQKQYPVEKSVPRAHDNAELNSMLKEMMQSGVNWVITAVVFVLISGFIATIKGGKTDPVKDATRHAAEASKQMSEQLRALETLPLHEQLHKQRPIRFKMTPTGKVSVETQSYPTPN